MKPGTDYVGIFVAAIAHDGVGNFLMGKRGGNARDRIGQWEFGGGMLEVGETVEECLRRETREEYGAELTDIQQVEVLEKFHEGGHWLGIFCLAKIDRAAAHIAEPVYDELGWFTPATMPDDLESENRKLIKRWYYKIKA